MLQLRINPMLLLLSALMVLLDGPAALAETLQTPNFRVTITSRCPEGTVTCEDVAYVGRDRRTGASIQLTGRTVHTTCADGVTPCRFVGYEFRNGDYRYIVTAAGELQVYRGQALLLQEQGSWER